MDYYIMKDNVQQGPYSEEDMEAMYIANRLPGVTPVWYEGAENWMTFSATPIFETIKNSKRHTIFLMLLPIIIIPIPFIYIIFPTIAARVLILVLYYGIWVGLAIYSGVWKDFLPAAKKIYWAYKQARLLAKQQKKAS